MDWIFRIFSLLLLSDTTLGTYLKCHDCSHETCDDVTVDRAGKCRPQIGGKCFYRQDPNGLTYRGCADQKSWPNLDTSYTGCRRQYYMWWDRTPVLWCFCDSDMCNTNMDQMIAQYGDVESARNENSGESYDNFRQVSTSNRQNFGFIASNSQSQIGSNHYTGSQATYRQGPDAKEADEQVEEPSQIIHHTKTQHNYVDKHNPKSSSKSWNHNYGKSGYHGGKQSYPNFGYKSHGKSHGYKGNKYHHHDYNIIVLPPSKGGSGGQGECRTLACDHFCENDQNGAVCRCRRGFYLLPDRLTCKDVNECDHQNGGCDHLCTNSIGSYTCRCQSSGYALANDGKTCVDTNECSINNGRCSHFCENSDGSYRCYCPLGYELQPDGHTCIDVNECRLAAGHNCQQVCTNIAGAYRCDCNQGYQLNPHDLSTCDDVDECASQTHGCGQQCHNSPGSYSCQCGQGYRLGRNGRSCIDINECLVSMGGCVQRCVNTAGSYYCDCHSGFVLNPDQRTCDDANECGAGNGGCDHICMNNNGSFVCSCNPGYTLDLDRFSCRDINECVTLNGGCAHICQNILGSYRCSCFPGSSLNADGHSCDVQDPCVTNNGGCEHECIRTAVGRRCSCRSGYRLDTDGTSCIDENECLFNNGGCAHNCQNSLGSFTCSCRSGYVLDPDRSTCNDVNECLVNNGGCEVTCQNSPGSFYCECNRGFRLDQDGFRCIDVDECLVNNGGCSQVCTNTVGSYSCSCTGDLYTLDIDGRTCRATCPPTFVRPTGLDSCYKVFTARTEADARTVRDATAFCGLQHPQAKLISIESQAEQNFIGGYLSNEPDMLEGWQGWWTSGVYRPKEREFKWENDRKIGDNSPNWGFKSPVVENTCVWVLQISVYNYKWGNYDCEEKSGFVCEIKLPN